MAVIIACDTAFYTITVVYRCYCMALFHSKARRHIMINNFIQFSFQTVTILFTSLINEDEE